MPAAAVRRELALSPTTTSTVFGIALATFTVAVLLGGHLDERHGPRPTLLTAAALAGGGLGTASLAAGPVTLAAGVGVLFGTANGLGYAAGVAVAGRARRRGPALAAVVGGYAAGAVLAAPVLAIAVAAAGWRATLAWLGILVTLLVVVAATAVGGQRATLTRSRPAASRGGGPAPPAAPVLRLWVVFGAASAPALYAFAVAADVVTARGAAAMAGPAAAAIAGGNLAGRVAGGLATDRWSTPALLRAAGIGTGSACLALAATDAPAMVALAALFALGAAYGTLAAVLPAAVGDVVGPRRVGAVYGRIFTAWGIAGAAAPPAGTALAASLGRPAAPFLVGAACSVLATATVPSLDLDPPNERA